jgi:murein DD-endopeptidase MepM/ murein hydrolase activator NlpD
VVGAAVVAVASLVFTNGCDGRKKTQAGAAGKVAAASEPSSEFASLSASSASASTASLAVDIGRGRFVWPTPLPVTAETPWEKIVQASASGDPSTGLFGTARNSGGRFHEGLDIRPHSRNRRREPTDVVRAAIAGVVAHVAPTPNGAYGRYVVLSHSEEGLSFYTLYAHLSAVDSGLKAGAAVEAGDKLGVMGRSDGAGGFSKERAHLHFEMGLRISPNFGQWYARKQKEFGAPNRHGLWNGYNLYGCDPLPFVREGLRTGATPSLLAQIRREPTAVTVLVNSRSVPAFVLENPALLTAPAPKNIGGWKIDFAWHGMPLSFTPLGTPPVTGRATMEVQMTRDAALQRKARVRRVLAQKRDGGLVAGETLTNVVTLLFE